MSFLTSIVVEFGSGADSSALVVIELDDTVNLDADGKAKTSFVDGDQPVFLVHFDSSALRIDAVKSSSGMVVDQGVVTRARQRRTSWTNTDTGQDMPHIPAGPVAVEWYGNSPAIIQAGRRLTIDGVFPAIGEASYSISAESYRLIPPPLDLADGEEWPVLIVVYMEAA